MTTSDVIMPPDRRDFLFIATGAAAAVGAAASTIPLVHSMNASADVIAQATIEVDLEPIQEGQRASFLWRGKPVFIVHRTPREIAMAVAADDDPSLKDPATDASRVQRSQWLVLIGVCTHLGCSPIGQGNYRRGPWEGWSCMCHGSAYDTSGRIRRGPANKNLEVPPYEFLSDTRIRIG